MMVTLPSLAVREVDRLGPLTEPCPHCGSPVAWMNTHLGPQLPFDPRTYQRGLDADAGWAPGVFRIARRHRLAMAPLRLHPAEKRARITQVMHPHTCPGWRQGAAA